MPSKPGPSRTVSMFRQLCFSKLPDIEAIAKMAAAESFAELSGDELKPYQPEVQPEEFRAWRFKDFEAVFTLMVTRTKPDDLFKKSVPEFAESTNYACSLITPGRDAKTEVLKHLTEVVGRKPDERWDQGPMKVEAWSGQTKKVLSQVFHYALAKSANTSLLSASTFVKK